MKPEDLEKGTKFIAAATGFTFEVLKIEKALFADSYNVTIKNLENGRKSVHGLNYLSKLDLHKVK